MPRGDRSGPNGQGSKTGRGAGLCAGNNEPGCTTVGGHGGGRGGGRGAGMGCRGGGRGLGRSLNQGAGSGMGQEQRQRMGANLNTAPSADSDLSRKAQNLEAQIAEIKQQLSERS
ncbi:MAG: DUF5320 domain-containing protein [Desulfuromonadaceae bacterium]|nr:DUF5320 domain-containing protein [Desulfuromonas sp.]MDY0185548.1 DUF5320 domain-containing protein [Desulfuromonadaceae bacterium]